MQPQQPASKPPSRGTPLSKPPSRSENSSRSGRRVTDHEREVTSMVDQLTDLLQRRLAQQEAEMNTILDSSAAINERLPLRKQSPLERATGSTFSSRMRNPEESSRAPEEYSNQSYNPTKSPMPFVLHDDITQSIVTHAGLLGYKGLPRSNVHTQGHSLTAVAEPIFVTRTVSQKSEDLPLKSKAPTTSLEVSCPSQGAATLEPVECVAHNSTGLAETHEPHQPAATVETTGGGNGKEAHPTQSGDDPIKSPESPKDFRPKKASFDVDASPPHRRVTAVHLPGVPIAAHLSGVHLPGVPIHTGVPVPAVVMSLDGTREPVAEVSDSFQHDTSVPPNIVAQSFDNDQPTQQPSPFPTRLSGERLPGAKGSVSGWAKAVKVLSPIVTALSGQASPRDIHMSPTAVRHASVAIHGSVFNSGAELLRHLQESGLAPELLAGGGQLSGSNSSSPRGNPAVERWKQRVSLIRGPIQIGSKETLFAVRSEIEAMHKKFPNESKVLQSHIDNTRSDLAQIYSVLTNKQYIADSDTIKQQIGNTDEQIRNEVTAHGKMVSLLEAAADTMEKTLKDAGTVPGVPGDLATRTPQELDALAQQTSDPKAKRMILLVSLVSKMRQKVHAHRSAAQAAIEVSQQRRDDPRDALIAKAKDLAETVGVDLEAEAAALPPAELDPAALAMIDEDLMQLSPSEGSTVATSKAAAKPRPSLGGIGQVVRRLSMMRKSSVAAAKEPPTKPRDKDSPVDADNASLSSPPHSMPTSGRNASRQLPTFAGDLSQAQSDENADFDGSRNGRNSLSMGDEEDLLSTTSSSHSLSGHGLRRRSKVVSTAVSVTKKMFDNVVYTSQQRQEDARKLLQMSEQLRQQAREARDVAKADYAMRLAREEAQRERFESRTMDEVLRDAMENRVPSPINHINEWDYERIIEQCSESENLAQEMMDLYHQQMESIQLREELLGKAKFPLMAELKELEDRVFKNTAALHQAHLNRKNLVKQYWTWRQRVELGDAKVAMTFEDEVKRGPRFRSVGVQNSIQTEYLGHQLTWLRQLLRKEEVFRFHVHNIEMLVEDLEEVNALVERSVHCPHCHEIYNEPVAFWPCGHTFCLNCFDALSVGPSLHRCPVCYSIGAEGCIQNILLGEIIAKWIIKDSGYARVHESLQEVKKHMQMFHRDKVEMKLAALEYRIQQMKEKQLQAQLAQRQQEEAKLEETNEAPSESA